MGSSYKSDVASGAKCGSDGLMIISNFLSAATNTAVLVLEKLNSRYRRYLDAMSSLCNMWYVDIFFKYG